MIGADLPNGTCPAQAFLAGLGSQLAPSTRSGHHDTEIIEAVAPALGTWFASNPESERLLAQEGLMLEMSELVADALERRGLNRADLAQRLGVSRSEITQRLGD